MQKKSDALLLRDYAELGGEAAFRELVARHTDLVYSAALRQVNSPDLARDVGQSVFVDLARKAQEVSERLTADASLVGWLYRSTRFAALNYLRDDRRRATHERQAMEQLAVNSGPAPDWEYISPLLDEAMAGLSDDDREAVLLRYFKNYDFRAVGCALDLSDDAAQKRVSRAIERLREFFSQRGLTIGAGGLAVVISANAVQATPAGLAITFSAAALAGTATAHTSVAIAATKTLARTTFQKAVTAVAFAAAVGTAFFAAHQAAQQREETQVFQKQQATMAEQIQQLQQERNAATNKFAAMRQDNDRLKRNAFELLKLRAHVTNLSQRNQELAALTNSSGGSSNDNSRFVDLADYDIPNSWSNAGLTTPTTAARTYLWAMANKDSAKLEEVLLIPADVRDAYLKALEDKEGTNPLLKGARIKSIVHISDDECLCMIEEMEESPATMPSGDPFPITSLDTHGTIVRRTDGVWHVVLPEPGKLELPPELEKAAAEEIGTETLPVRNDSGSIPLPF